MWTTNMPCQNTSQKSCWIKDRKRLWNEMKNKRVKGHTFPWDPSRAEGLLWEQGSEPTSSFSPTHQSLHSSEMILNFYLQCLTLLLISWHEVHHEVYLWSVFEFKEKWRIKEETGTLMYWWSIWSIQMGLRKRRMIGNHPLSNRGNKCHDCCGPLLVLENINLAAHTG